ncbi:hypothetical protein [Planomonospora sp. ID67723]|uniref:hypothetical protein n=1 Tax=Planomonospora sp. ID67723 TaxID=2738134 RepID=UPI0018C413BC|nr:hypothetical protein [Planomonospora sp. ID67723]
MKRPGIRLVTYRRLRIPTFGEVWLHDSAKRLARLITRGQAVVRSVTVSRGGHRWYASVLWDGAVAMVPARVAQRSPAEGVVFRPITDAPPSRLVLAWRRTESSPLVSAYARLLAEVHRATP